MVNNDVRAESEERDEHRGLLSYRTLEFFFKYAVRPKKQFSVPHIVQESKTWRQQPGIKNNESTEGTGSTLVSKNYGRPYYGGLQDVFSLNC
jgi:hypothetical protein